MQERNPASAGPNPATTRRQLAAIVEYVSVCLDIHAARTVAVCRQQFLDATHASSWWRVAGADCSAAHAASGAAMRCRQALTPVTRLACPHPLYAQLIQDSTVYDLLPHADNDVLLVAGLLDQVVPADNSRVMADRLRRPWLITYPDAAHGALIQHQTSFLRVLDTFLSNF